ncbi:MAG: T9SS type A sorting domain-containing protein [Bacteroidia bacterium]
MFKLLFISFVFFFFFQSNANAQWVQTGSPPSPHCIAADAGNLYVGTRGYGVYKSTDGGASWTAINNGLEGHFVESILVAPASSGNGTILYAGMGDGIWRSDDEGANWIYVYPGVGNNDITIIALGAGGSTIVAGARQQGSINGASGVYRSVDDGQTWIRDNAGFTTDADYNIWSFTSIRSGTTTSLYTATNGGVFSSTSGGPGWTRISSGLPLITSVNSTIMNSIAAIPSGSGGQGITLIAASYEQGAYRSTDNGSSWSEANSGIMIQGNNTIYINDLAASPSPEGTTSAVFAAAWPTVYVTLDGGLNWLDTFWPHQIANEADKLCINGGTLYVIAHVDQIWKYAVNPENTWVIQPSGTTDTLKCVKAVDNNVVWTGGTNGTVLYTTNSGTSWKSVGGGSIGSDAVDAVEAINANTAFVATYSGNIGRIFRTTNGGSSWSSVESKSGVAFGGIQMKTALEGYAVGSPINGKWNVLKTTDAGATWTSLATAPAEDSLTVLGENYAGPHFVRPYGVQIIGDTLWFASVSGVVYRSTDLGAIWSTGTSNSPLNSIHFNSSTVGLSGSSYSDSIRFSVNGGISWQNANAAWTKPITSISGSGNEFWATTGSSIAYTKNLGQDWSFSTPGYWGLTENLNALSFSQVTSPLNGWAVGAAGLILHYQRNGSTPTKINMFGQSSGVRLEQSYPNPFSSSTTIKYQVTEPEFVSLKIFDAMGTEVAILVNEQKPAGEYLVEWNAAGFGSGIYFCKLQNGNSCELKKMIKMH